MKNRLEELIASIVTGGLRRSDADVTIAGQPFVASAYSMGPGVYGVTLRTRKSTPKPKGSKNV